MLQHKCSNPARCITLEAHNRVVVDRDNKKGLGSLDSFENIDGVVPQIKQDEVVGQEEFDEFFGIPLIWHGGFQKIQKPDTSGFRFNDGLEFTGGFGATPARASKETSQRRMNLPLRTIGNHDAFEEIVVEESVAGLMNLLKNQFKTPLQKNNSSAVKSIVNGNPGNPEMEKAAD